MDHPKIVHDAITFDDVLLIPAASDFTPAEADTPQPADPHASS